MPGALAGVTVIDLTRVLSGPYCTMVLADHGARVIKVEHPVRGDDTRHWGPPFVASESAYFLSINRNKESVTVDFKQAEGGLMSITGEADGPPYRLGVAITDIVSGLFAAQGVMSALFARERTGRGQHVDIGMLDATAALLTYQAGNYFTTGQVP